jgi:hypothetical protein
MLELLFDLERITIVSGKVKMKACIIMTAGVVALLFLSTTGWASSVSDAQDRVDQAQADFDQAKSRALSSVSSSDKSAWKQAEAKYESMVAAGKDPKQISAQREVVEGIESHAMKSADQEKIDDARDQLTAARAKLAFAKAQASPPHQTISNDDSSQAIQPENRTQNGANFSIRSQRDSENHPPLPSSQ